MLFFTFCDGTLLKAVSLCDMMAFTLGAIRHDPDDNAATPEGFINPF